MTPVSLDLQSEFPILAQLTFLNHAAVSPISKRAGDALCEYAAQAQSQSYFGQPWYRRAREVKRLAAKLINADGEGEIAFIPNTSTGISTIAKGVNWRPHDNVVITNVEYPANRYPWEDLKRFGVKVIEVKQLSDGRIDAEDLADAVTDHTRIVAVSHVQYATGCRVDLKMISDVVHQAGGYLCVDAIQSVGALPVDVKAMGIDFLIADGHKWMMGPEGCGFMYVREDMVELLHPNVVGWMNMINASDYGNYQFEFQKDARRFEPGSYNIPGIAALGASLELILEVGIEVIWSRIQTLTNHLCDGLKSKGYRVRSPRGSGETSGIVTFEPPAESVRETPAVLQIVRELEKQKIVIAIRDGKMRASPHFYNTLEQMDALVAALP